MVARGRGAGRPGSLDEARELIALVSSLSEAGDSLSADAVSERLGVSRERADKLIELVLSSTLISGAGLPLVEDEDTLTLVSERGARGRRLRLSHAETLALAAALERLGVPADDPLRSDLESSLSADPVDEGLVRSLMAGSAGTGSLATTLSACGHTIAERLEATFSYRKVGEKDPELRHVVPLGLRSEDDTWFLDAHDLDRNAARTFRVDRMTDVETGRRADRAPVADKAVAPRTVRVTFDDASLLDLLPWHELRMTSAEGELPVVAETPWYGGMWLPRMLAACGRSARCDDAEVTNLVQAYAREQLS